MASFSSNHSLDLYLPKSLGPSKLYQTLSLFLFEGLGMLNNTQIIKLKYFTNKFTLCG